MAASSSDSGEKSLQQDFDPNELLLRKRLPRKLPKRHNDIYVNSKSNFIAQIKRCEKLLDAGESEVYIHGLGFAVHIAMNIALRLQQEYAGSLQVSVNTSTVELIDDLEPLTDEKEPEIKERSNSAIHIKLFRTSDDVIVPGKQEDG